MGRDHGFDAIGDEFTRGQRILHARVRHGQAVTDTDGIEFKRNTTRIADRLLNEFGNLVQMNVAWNDFNKRTANANERLIEIFFLQTNRVKQAAVRCAFKPLFDNVAVHVFSVPMVIIISGKLCASQYTPISEPAQDATKKGWKSAGLSIEAFSIFVLAVDEYFGDNLHA